MSQDALLQNIAELQSQLQNLDSMYRERNDDVHVLSQHLGQLLTETISTGDNLTDNILASLSPDAKTLLHNMVRLKTENGVSTHLLQPPSIYNFFPHLHDNPFSLCPALCLSKGRSGGRYFSIMSSLDPRLSHKHFFYYYHCLALQN